MGHFVNSPGFLILYILFVVIILRIIDVHVHLGGIENKEDTQWYHLYLSDILSYMHEAGIEKCILLSNAKDGSHYKEAQIFQNICKHYPSLFSWMAGIDSDCPVSEIYSNLRLYKAMGACGIGEVITHKYFNSEFVCALFSSAQMLNLPVLFHMSPCVDAGYGLIDHSKLPLLEESLRKYPSLKIIGHSQPFWHEISADSSSNPLERNLWGSGKVLQKGQLLYLLEHYNNLYCDLSANSGGCAIMRDTDFGIWFVNTYADRLLFGSDVIGDGNRFPLLNWLKLQLELGNISNEVFNKISYLNAKEIFKLS